MSIIKGIKVGDPFTPTNFYGPQVSQKQFEVSKKLLLYQTVELTIHRLDSVLQATSTSGRRKVLRC